MPSHSLPSSSLLPFFLLLYSSSCYALQTKRMFLSSQMRESFLHLRSAQNPELEQERTAHDSGLEKGELHPGLMFNLALL